MVNKFFPRSLIVSLLMFALLIGANTTSGVFEEEQLYPVDSLTTTINPPMILPTGPKKEVNPWKPDLPAVPKITRPNSKHIDFSNSFDARNLNVKILTSSLGTKDEQIKNCKTLLEQTLSALPANLTESLDSMKLFFNNQNPRGLSNSHLIELRCGNLEEDEIVAVFIHELGHIIDLGNLKGVSFAPSGFKDGSLKIPADDPSVEFYQLSWKNEKTQKFTAERKDFVSGYAMSDPFEDFAESFNFYVLHGKDFRAIKKESYILAKKYNFLRNVVFGGIEFESKRSTKNGKRIWDTTLLEFNREQFFASETTTVRNLEIQLSQLSANLE